MSAPNAFTRSRGTSSVITEYISHFGTFNWLLNVLSLHKNINVLRFALRKLVVSHWPWLPWFPAVDCPYSWEDWFSPSYSLLKQTYAMTPTFMCFFPTKHSAVWNFIFVVVARYMSSESSCSMEYILPAYALPGVIVFPKIGTNHLKIYCLQPRELCAQGNIHGNETLLAKHKLRREKETYVRIRWATFSLFVLFLIYKNLFVLDY